eukprot:COSAG02_NODE_15040_length_1210_cov_1.549955_1_plen_397_part_01
MLVVEGSDTDVGQYDTENPVAVVPDWDAEAEAEGDDKSKKKKKVEEWNPNDDGIHDLTAEEVAKKGGVAIGKTVIIVCCFLFLGGIVLYEEHDDQKKPPKITSSTTSAAGDSHDQPPPPPSPSVAPPPPGTIVAPTAGCGELQPPPHAHVVGICPADEPNTRCTIACDEGYRAVGSTNYKCFADVGRWGAGRVDNAPSCVMPDACASHPCVANGDGLASCRFEHLDASSTLPRYTCTCSAGWTGDNCDNLADVCSSNPCLNGAECRGYGDRYQCICELGWRGDNCQIDYNECILPGLCQHGGTCSESTSNAAVPPGEFECNCVSGYAGERCSDTTDHCLVAAPADGCLNGGECRSSITGFKCRCTAGYAGSRCETDIVECASHPCVHGVEAHSSSSM